MPRVLKPGDKINGYSITKHLNTGAMANAFAAVNKEGRKVFFKQYKSPAVAVTWFQSYVEYQKELNRRVAAPNLKRFCVHQLDSFVFKFGVDTFFQVYEFIEGGHDLESILQKIRSNPSSLNWHQRTILAKVMMAGIHQLHEQRIAHCDLKPPNLQMLEDSSIEAGYQLKLIDMDFSVLSDQKAPWHGRAPYVGTPRYFSPEHLKGEVPSRESDIFTCGIILYELLAAGHPFPADTDEAFFAKVKSRSASPPILVGALSSTEATQTLVDTIFRCISPTPEDRPSALDVNLALNGKAAHSTKGKTEAVKPATSGAPSSVGHSPEHGKPDFIPIKLINSAGRQLTCNVTSSIGKHLLRQLGEEAKYAEDHQFTLERRGFDWWLVPQSGTPNYTLHNGEPALIPVKLKSSDRIELGGRTSGKRLMPLTVDLT